jgi:hypothetical protein
MAYVSQEDKKALAPAIKAVMKKYKMKGTIAVRHHSTLVVNIKEGAIDFGEFSHGEGYAQVNPYWIHEHYTGKAKRFLTELLQAMKGPKFFDHSDAQTDYFHRSHYQDINIGAWDKPYQQVVA